MMLTKNCYSMYFTQKEVLLFFDGIRILKREKGVFFLKNHKMMAYIALKFKKDLKAALKLNRTKFGQLCVRGKYKNTTIHIILDEGLMAVELLFFHLLSGQSQL